MVDVVKHSLFPTIINSFEFDMDEQEYNLVINKLNNIEKSREELIIQTPDNLFIDIPKFANSIGTITEKVCEDLNYKYESIENTGPVIYPKIQWLFLMIFVLISIGRANDFTWRFLIISKLAFFWYPGRDNSLGVP